MSLDKKKGEEIIKEILDDINYIMYLDANPKLKERLGGDEARARHHFRHSGFYEIYEGKRRLYPNVPIYRERDYIKEHRWVLDLVAEGEYLSPYHHFLKNAREFAVPSFNKEVGLRSNAIYTFYTEPFVIDFRDNLHTGQPYGRYVRIEIDGHSRMDYQRPFIQVNGQVNNHMISKKVYSKTTDECRIFRKGNSIQIPYGKAPFFIVDLEYECFIDVISFFIKNIEVEKQSNISVHVSRDMEVWHPVYVVDTVLTRKRMEVIAQKDVDRFCLKIPCRFCYRDNEGRSLYEEGELKEELGGIAKELTEVVSRGVIVQGEEEQNILNELRERLRHLYDLLPVTTDFSSVHDRVLELKFEEAREGVIIAIPSKEYRQISLGLFSGNEEVTIDSLKRMNEIERIGQEIYAKGEVPLDPGSFYSYYSFFEVRGERAFDVLRVYNREDLAIFTKEWFVFDAGNLRLLYDHHEVYRAYRRLYMMTNVFLKRDAEDMRYLVGTYVMSGRHGDVLSLFRNYALDERPETVQLDTIHEEVRRLAGLSIRSKFKILTKHGVHDSIKKKDPIQLTLAMKQIQELFRERIGKMCVPFYGTLLGMVRDGDFIEHDDDIDMIYLGEAESFDEMLVEKQEVIEVLKDLGFVIVNNYQVGDRNFHVRVGNLHVDIFPTFRQEGGYAFYSSGSILIAPFEAMLPLKKTDFYNTELLIPNHPEILMRIRYGKEWNVADWNFGFVCTRRANYHVL